MITLEEIRNPVEHHIGIFEKKFYTYMKSSVPLLNVITRYLYRRKGKQMRPLFVFLSAGISGEINESTYRAASLIELLHTATLVHDDVVDDSDERRGFFSINALWKNKIAVLVGDYLLSRGLMIALEGKDYNLLEIVSNSVKQMSEGELLQIEKARRLDIEEEIYFEIIRKKTASLISSCCACGASSTGCSSDIVEKMRDFGEKVGIAFQIKDDLFDFDAGNKSGKPKGIDIKDRKMTLPVIYMLSQMGTFEKREVIHAIKSRRINSHNVSKVIEKVNNSGGIEYAQARMIEYRDKALEILHSFPESQSRDSLEKLVMFSTERNE